MRPVLLILHRWAGLTIALALVVTGLTGAILPFQDELRRVLAPEIWNSSPPGPDAERLSGMELMRIAERETGGRVGYMPLSPPEDHAQSIFVSPRPGGPQLDYQQIFVDPYSGDIRARVRFADLRDGGATQPRQHLAHGIAAPEYREISYH